MQPVVPASTTNIAFLDDATPLDGSTSPNLVAMPSLATLSGDAYADAVAKVVEYGVAHRAFFIVDPPADWTSVDGVVKGLDRIASIVRENGAMYWPSLLNGVSLSRAVASVYVATDESRGVWKAPAGIDAVLADAVPSHKLTDAENGVLHSLGVNCIRVFPVYGTVVWGARTLAGADLLDSEWKYVFVRRLALFIESSIKQSLEWTTFQPNAERLWSAITFSVTQFMQGLWTQGAFAGPSAKDAYFVQCDSTTTTPDDIQLGIVNVIVGFAPVMPAEFVVLQIQVIAAVP